MGVEVYLHLFLTSVLDGSEWSASRAGRFTPGEMALGAPLTRGLGRPSSQYGRFGEETNFLHPPIFEPRFHRHSARSIVTKASTLAYVIHTHSCLHLPPCRTYSSGLSPAALLPVHVLSVWDGKADPKLRTCTSLSSVNSYLLQQTPFVPYTSLRHFRNIPELIRYKNNTNVSTKICTLHVFYASH
jgi:hypothetical protein